MPLASRTACWEGSRHRCQPGGPLQVFIPTLQVGWVMLSASLNPQGPRLASGRSVREMRFQEARLAFDNSKEQSLLFGGTSTVRHPLLPSPSELRSAPSQPSKEGQRGSSSACRPPPPRPFNAVLSSCFTVNWTALFIIICCGFLLLSLHCCFHRLYYLLFGSF